MINKRSGYGDASQLLSSTICQLRTLRRIVHAGKIGDVENTRARFFRQATPHGQGFFFMLMMTFIRNIRIFM